MFRIVKRLRNNSEIVRFTAAILLAVAGFLSSFAFGPESPRGEQVCSGPNCIDQSQPCTPYTGTPYFGYPAFYRFVPVQSEKCADENGTPCVTSPCKLKLYSDSACENQTDSWNVDKKMCHFPPTGGG